MGRLQSKVAIITGGGSGIGLATAQRFVSEGASVMLVDQNESALSEAKASLGDQAQVFTADVRETGASEAFVNASVEAFGGVDIFVANAGTVGAVEMIGDMSPETFDNVMSLNVRAAWLGCKAVIPHMTKRGGGSIIVTSSIAGVTGAPMVAPYCISKHALIGLARSLAMECAGAKIRVNAVGPSAIDTDMTRNMSDLVPGISAEFMEEQVLSSIPLGRYGTPKEVSELMLFLAGDESSFCTGGVFMIDGGHSAA